MNNPINQLKLYGMNQIFNEIVNLFISKKLPNKILLSGSKGCGKATFAYHFINYVFSINQENSYNIKLNEINANNASFGGSIYIDDCSGNLDIINNGLYGGSASYGGGIYQADSTLNLEQNRFGANEAYQGGGIFCFESINTITDCWFGDNQAEGSAPGDSGAAIYNLVSYSDIFSTEFCGGYEDVLIYGAWGNNGENAFYEFCDDCDGNGQPDTVDIKLDPSLDCDLSGLLDVCEIESGLLPGSLITNKTVRFLSQEITLNVETSNSPFSNKLKTNTKLKMPIAHKQGNYFADEKLIKKLEDEDRIVFTYFPDNSIGNPNGSLNSIAGVLNKGRNVLGMMPHPERASENILCSSDGKKIFESFLS